MEYVKSTQNLNKTFALTATLSSTICLKHKYALLSDHTNNYAGRILDFQPLFCLIFCFYCICRCTFSWLPKPGRVYCSTPLRLMLEELTYTYFTREIMPNQISAHSVFQCRALIWFGPPSKERLMMIYLAHLHMVRCRDVHCVSTTSYVLSRCIVISPLKTWKSLQGLEALICLCFFGKAFVECDLNCCEVSASAALSRLFLLFFPNVSLFTSFCMLPVLFLSLSQTQTQTGKTS